MDRIASFSWRQALQVAQSHAQRARFDTFLRMCREIIESSGSELEALLSVASLLSSFGFITDARQCYCHARTLAPYDQRPVIGIANLARDAGNHVECRQLYETLLQQFPDDPVIRRNALTSLEYDADVTDEERSQMANAWGEWALVKAGGKAARPALQTLKGRPLRVGYVSADFCQHTVGLFVKGILAAHDEKRVTVFAYSAGAVNDWVTLQIQLASTFRDVSSMSDAGLVNQIMQDKIDVLVDLSGHTAGSRLTAFASRPAPVQVSWLGYFATTGLSVIDAVLLDSWHAPQWTESQFVESVIRLPAGRFCYTPVPFAPEQVVPPPCIAKGYVTFGCFNNTAKLNSDVFALWSKILAAIPNSRLVLKWRTFQDAELRDTVRSAFVDLGIASERIELRGASFHADLLQEYADIDIALDPFPFTGGLTSCEALWMGVPVVTWPRSRVVSRQTFALLSAINLPELAAKDGDDYVRIAAGLAKDSERLFTLRRDMRARMRASGLMNVSGFTRQLEQCMVDLYEGTFAHEKGSTMNTKTVLHVGPGHRLNGARLPVAFRTAEWRELRLDIDPENAPDIVGSILDIAAIADNSVDVIYSSHNIEHIYAHEVVVALKEFFRVLKPGGYLVVTCPDLQAVCALVVEDKLTDPAYQSPAGPITPLDILFGHGAALAAGNHYMAHKTGFTLKSLTAALQLACFQSIAGARRLRGLDLWVVATKSPMEDSQLRALAQTIFPT